MCSPPFYKCRIILTERSKFHIKKHISPKFKFAEYFFYNREIVNRQKLFKNFDPNALVSILKTARMSKAKLSDFSLMGLHNSGSFGNTYLIKRRKEMFYLKTIRSKFINMSSDIDFMTTNYIGLLRERDALLNCGGVWTPKVFQTLDFHNLPISIVIEAVVGWPLKRCIHVIHVGSCSRCLIFAKRNQMTVKAQSALLTGSAEFIEPIQSSIIPIIRFWIAELLVAIRFIHQQGVLHRDLRPDNIIVTDRGHLKLTDFGLNTELYSITSNKSDSTISYQCTNCFTELPENIISPDPFDTRRRSYANRHLYPFRNFGVTAYAAPELHSSSTVAEYTSKCDYWSAGCIFFYMLFMINPFDVCHTSIEEAKLMLAEKSLLNPAIIDRRCWNVPSAKQLLLEILCVEPSRRLDDNLSENNWLPESLEFFDSLDFKNLQKLDAPFKPVILDPDVCFDLLPMDDDDIIHDMMEDIGKSPVFPNNT